jgi:hypothetical protein
MKLRAVVVLSKMEHVIKSAVIQSIDSCIPFFSA